MMSHIITNLLLLIAGLKLQSAFVSIFILCYSIVNCVLKKFSVVDEIVKKKILQQIPLEPVPFSFTIYIILNFRTILKLGRISNLF